jgi:ketosteroid isomerase-like protein
MKKIIAVQAAVIAALLVALFASPLCRTQAGTEPAPDALFQTIQSLDAQLFDAYNRCDLEKFGSFLTEDLEFYHDKTGLARSGKALVEGVKNNICGKVTRDLVPGTLEVYPIKSYGAVEIGVHRFHHPGHEDSESVGEAKFIQLWQQKDGAWKLTRVISFDHHSMAK